MKRDDPDWYAATLMNYVLGGGGFNSRLMNEVRDRRGLAYGASSRLTYYNKGGLFTASVATMNERVGSDDMDMVVTAILIQRNTGGNLAEVLDNVTETMRDRERILARARGVGLVTGSDTLSEDDVYQFIFHPGLSTADTITARAGRVIEGAIRGDWAPLAGVLENPKGLERVQQLLTKRLDGLKEHGSIRGYSIPSVTPAWWSKDHRVATVIRIASDTDSAWTGMNGRTSCVATRCRWRPE